MKIYLLYFLALVSLSTSPIFTRYSGIPVESLGFWRLIIASLAMWPVAFWHGRKAVAAKQKGLLSDAHFKASQWESYFSPTTWSMISGFFFFVHLWTYFYAAHHTRIANAVIIFSTNPLFTSALSYFILQEKLNRRLIVSYFIAMFGIYFLVSENLTLNPEYFWGDLSALGSAFLFAFYLNAGKLARHHFDNSKYAAIKYSTAAVLFLILALSKRVPIYEMPPSGWLSVFGMVLIPTFLGHFLFSYLMRYMSLNFMTCGKLVEPAFSALFAFLFFSEKLGSATLIAFALTSAAVLVLFWPMSNEKKTNGT